jgi:hypothetical protein
MDATATPTIPPPQPQTPPSQAKAASVPPPPADSARPTVPPPTPTQGSAAPRPPQEQQQDWLNRALAGDRTAIPHVQDLLDANPQNWREAMGLVRISEALWLQKLAAGDLMYEEALRRQLEELKRGLLGTEPNALEKVLVDRIGAAWLAVNYAEQEEAANIEQTNPQSKVRRQRLESANRRLLAATKSLAQIRRLAGGLKVEITHAVPTPATAPADQVPTSAPSTDPRMVPPPAEQSVDDAAQRLRGLLSATGRAEAAALR